MPTFAWSQAWIAAPRRFPWRNGLYADQRPVPFGYRRQWCHDRHLYIDLPLPLAALWKLWECRWAPVAYLVRAGVLTLEEGDHYRNAILPEYRNSLPQES